MKCILQVQHSCVGTAPIRVMIYVTLECNIHLPAVSRFRQVRQENGLLCCDFCSWARKILEVQARTCEAEVRRSFSCFTLTAFSLLLYRLPLASYFSRLYRPMTDLVVEPGAVPPAVAPRIITTGGVVPFWLTYVPRFFFSCAPPLSADIDAVPLKNCRLCFAEEAGAYLPLFSLYQSCIVSKQ
ncbi:hypothetical protein BD289DRAFT_242791 [Coniella lustricola]|uniref:Uncharacterized protein n=1 Tax=Coniella lustricola TaxID=2025994 RepID=A0A2T3A9F6_9PEZI|nr:hypothetical protein BD289DRAFT_242791 [Coniella lustricola]